MTARPAEIAAVCGIAILITLVLAAPVLRSPSERIFGMELVGRHADPFTAIERFGGPMTFGIYLQPLTDVPGALLVRLLGPVAAYNCLVLLTFPLSAAAAYALARHLRLAPGAAGFAALAFAFSPFHLAHAAYHPHVAQTQWIPLYLLALWRCLDGPRTRDVILLAASIAGVALANFYGGFIAAALTPVAVGGYWWFNTRSQPHSGASLAITVATLTIAACGGLGYTWYAAHHAAADSNLSAFPREDLFRYSAKWWSYLVPPVANPALGGSARHLWSAVDVHEGLLEQQVSLGWGVVALALVAVGAYLTRGRRAALTAVPVLLLVGGAALLCSLSPERTVGMFTFTRPSAFLYYVAPMFRSYARFGVVVQLATALMAGLGAHVLWSSNRRAARMAGLALVTLAAAEYAVWPPAQWRDVLPTIAHRWLTSQAGHVHALDCATVTPDAASIAWLTNGRIRARPGDFDDCAEPNVAEKLAAGGYTHLLVRRGTPEEEWLARQGAPEGLQLQRRFGDADVFSVSAAPPRVYTAAMNGFYPREYDATSTWRWMGAGASWNVMNSSQRTVRATADLEVGAVHGTRRLAVLLDGTEVQMLTTDESRRVSRIGPIVLTPGTHEIVFHSVDPPTVARDLLNNGDSRPLSFRFGAWQWGLDAGRP